MTVARGAPADLDEMDQAPPRQSAPTAAMASARPGVRRRTGVVLQPLPSKVPRKLVQFAVALPRPRSPLATGPLVHFGRVDEVVSVAPDGAELFADGRVERVVGLEADRDYVVGGLSFHTMGDLGEVHCVVATGNDVHFGETVCGHLEGVEGFECFEVDEGEAPYPEVMNAAVVDDVVALDPSCVVVKGDLTDDGAAEDYSAFLDTWGRVGDRLVHVRGNHDSYAGRSFADWPRQSRRLDGVTVALLDTARLHRIDGALDAEQLEWLDDLGRDSDQPVLVMGHHQPFDASRDAPEGFHGLEPSSTAALLAVLRRRPALRTYLAGHTHRNRRRRLDGVDCAEVACVKDFPGAYAEYRVCERGIAAIVHRASAPEAVAWAERTRQMFGGLYGPHALGRLSDRAYVVGEW